MTRPEFDFLRSIVDFLRFSMGKVSDLEVGGSGFGKSDCGEEHLIVKWCLGREEWNGFAEVIGLRRS